MADAATEFLPAARSAESSMGDLVGSAVVDLVMADARGRQATMGIIEELVSDKDGKPRPNLEFESQISLPDLGGKGEDKAISTHFSVPLLTLAEMSAFLPQTGKIDTSMSLSAHAEDADSLKAEVTGSGSADLGYGPLKVGIKVEASFAVSKERKRSSDMRNDASISVEMGRVAPPEGLMRIVDGLTDTVEAGLKIEMQLVKRQIAQIAHAAGLQPATPGDQPKPS